MEGVTQTEIGSHPKSLVALLGVTLEGGVTTALADATRRLIGCPKTFLQKWGDVEFKY